MIAAVSPATGACSPKAARREKETIPFLPYVHQLRALAIVGVVASHTDFIWPQGSVCGLLALSVIQDSSAVFLLVSGFLFQHLSSRFNYAHYLKRKLLNVICPYVVCSIPALFYQWLRHTGIFALNYPRHFSSPLAHAALAVVTAGHMPAPMWFIPMIAVIYVAAPLFIAIDRRPGLYWVTLPLLALAVLCHRPILVAQIGQALVYFVPAYLVGMWLSHYRDRVIPLAASHSVQLVAAWLAIDLFCVLVLKRTGVVYSRRPFSTEAGILDINLPSKLLLSACLMGVLFRGQRCIGTKLDYLADASFGVFFTHKYVIDYAEILAARFHHPIIGGSFVTFLGLLALYLVVSLLIVASLRAVTGKRSRLLIGC